MLLKRKIKSRKKSSRGSTRRSTYRSVPPKGLEMHLDDAAFEHVKSLRTLYKDMKQLITEYVEKIETLQKELKKVMGDKQFALYDDKVVYTWGESAIQKCEYDKLKEELPEIYEKYVTLVNARRFKVIGYSLPRVQIYPYKLEELENE